MEIPPISLGAIAGTPYGLQVAQRVQYAVAQVIASHGGVDQTEVVKALNARIRALGVNPNPREVSHLAEVIAKLPKRE
jgi:hypothetical protein